MTSSGDEIDSRNLFIPIVHVRGTHYECGFSVVIFQERQVKNLIF